MLRRVDVERRSLVIEKRGTPTAVLLNIRDYVKLAAPEPEVLKIIGDEAKRNRSPALTSRQIDEVVKLARADKKSAAARSPPSHRHECPGFAALKPEGLQRTTFLLAITKPARLYVSAPILV